MSESHILRNVNGIPKSRIWHFGFLLALLGASRLAAQQIESRSPVVAGSQFQLVDEDTNGNFEVVFGLDTLTVARPTGDQVIYQRNPAYDSVDGQWIGYSSQHAGRALLWPVSNSGSLRIARLGSDDDHGFSASHLSIDRSGRTAPHWHGQTASGIERTLGRPAVPPIQSGAGTVLAELAISRLFDTLSKPRRAGVPESSAQLLRIAATSARNEPLVLSRTSALGVRAQPQARANADWWVSPVAGGCVRVQTYRQDIVYSLAANRSGQLVLVPTGQSPHQLWKVIGSSWENQFVLANMAFPGHCLTHMGGGGLGLQPIAFQPAQLWTPFSVAPTATFQPFWRTVTTEIITNQTLAPAEIELKNSHRYALVVALGDTRKGQEFEQLRIEPGESLVVTLDRDAGARYVETIEVRLPGGVWDQRRFVTEIPPQALYDLSVYEEHLQSIAIDATGTSPNVIEDVNYVPKSVGWLPLPGGPAMPQSGVIDVYARAKAAKNPGAVRRLDPDQFDDQGSSDPLETILDRVQSRSSRKF